MPRTGRPAASPEARFKAKVRKDPGSGCWIWTASTDRDGYGWFWSNGVMGAAHRWSYENFIATIPAGVQIDHICRNRSCVNPDHLRPATNKQNSENKEGPLGGSGVRGVDRHHNRWHARVMHHGTPINVGYFDTIEEAEAAVIAKRLELFTHNDPDRSQ